jgi:hypothetical protein
MTEAADEAATPTELEEAVTEDVEASPADADEVRGGRAPSPPSKPVPIPYPNRQSRIPG